LATRRLAAEIGADEQALPDAIRRRNRRRSLFAAAAKLRADTAAPRGSEMDRIFRAADLSDADAFDVPLGDWLMCARAHGAGPRLLLAGSAPPDERLHRAVESAGGNIVAEFGDHASCGAASPVISPDEPMHALADHYQALCAGTRAFVDRAPATTSLAESVHADGVIIWLVEQEEALIWDLPAQSAALAAAGIPLLSLSRRRWDGTDGALDEIGAFTQRLGRRA
jgi:benzoyl-CoA reductase/2-hydroxyglutaryl-CoA dehydratase subunit BcrC/BadD/HgdB